MSVVSAAIKNGEIAIACDTQLSFGTVKVTAQHIVNSTKLYRVNESIIGMVGWKAIFDMVEHLIATDPELFELSTRMKIYGSLLVLHRRMKKRYFIEINEDHDDQPVESSQLDAIIVNRHGLFEISSYREVNQYSRYWAIGSGRKFALGAMQAIYDDESSAAEIARRGAHAACDFDDGCSLPVIVEVSAMTATSV